MATSPDGVLTVDFLPEQNLVRIVVHGDQWPPADYPIIGLTVRRSAPGEPTENVYATMQNAPGGWFTGVDNVAPMNTAVTYTVEALTAGWETLTTSVTVTTTGARWGLWLKDPQTASRNVCVEWRGIGARRRATQGAIHQPSGSPLAIVEHDGIAPDEVTIEVATRTAAATHALDALLRTARVLFVQSDPAEVPVGYYYLPVDERTNPAQVVETVEGYRVTTLPLVRSNAPSGDAAPYTGGPTFQSVIAQYATFQDVIDNVPSFLGLTNPEAV
jgi:hypothetical protein